MRVNILLPDQADRDAARKKLDRNVVVTAGAGTGKTSLLTDRALFALLGRGVPVQSLVALTFTEKAAGEIRLRVTDRLNDIVDLTRGEPQEERDKQWAEKFLGELQADFDVSQAKAAELAAAALENMDQAPIGTLHSFAAQILRAYPLEAGVDPAFAVDEGDLGEELFESEWAAWLDRELGERAPREKEWLEVLRLVPLEQIEALARALCSPRADLEKLRLSPDAVRDWMKESAHILESEPTRQPPAKGKIGEQLQELVARLKKLHAPTNGVPQKLPTSRMINASWPSGWDDANCERWEAATKLVAKCSSESEALIQHVARLLAPFAELYKKRYAWRGLISFEGLLLAARDLLLRDRAVREELKRKFRAFLVDEFQDTDPLQGEILLYLAERPGQAAKRWEDAQLEPGRLFVVGDPKQSIYRFRGADIAAYERFVAHILQGGILCELKTNFRSQPGVIQCVNAAFDRLMKPVAGSQPAYLPITAHSTDSAGGVESVTVQAGDAPVAKARRVEAEWIARWIETNRRQYAYRDIALLFRSTTPLSDYLEVFKTREIPYVVEGEKYFYGTQEVQDFLNLLRVLDDPGDQIALAGILRSPLVALTDEELRCRALGGLSYLRRRPGESRVPGLDAGLRRHDERAESLFAALREIRELVGRRPLTEILEAVYDKTRLLELASAAYHDQQTLANLLKLGRMAAASAEAQGETLKGFIHRITRFIHEAREEGESPLADEHLDAVRVLTIHKSKGLEYPVVILPNLGGKISGGRSDAPLRVDEEAGALGLRMGGGPANAAMIYLEERERRREKDEQIRLLYVAFTRAKEKLILVGSDKAESSSLAGALEKCELWPRLGPGTSHLEIPLGQTLGGGAGAALKKRPSVPLSLEAVAEAWKKRVAERESMEAQPRFITASGSVMPAKAGIQSHAILGPGLRRGDEESVPRGDLVGRLCHKALERWDFEASLVRLVSHAKDALAAEATEAELEAAAKEARAVLGEFEVSVVAKRLSKAEILGRELPFVMPFVPPAKAGAQTENSRLGPGLRRGDDEQQVARGTIDLLVRENGRLLVVDYKTDAVKPADLVKKTKSYEAQIELYAEAVGRALGEDEVGWSLVFLRAGKAVDGRLKR